MKWILVALFITGQAFAADLLVTLKSKDLSQLKSEKNISNVEKLLNFGIKEFENVYKVDIHGNIVDAKRNLESKDYILKVETIIQADLQSIFPKNNSELIANDPLSIYQWGLKNQEQVIYSDIDMYTTLPVVGIRGQDLGLPSEKLSNSMKKDVVVAVLDTGIDPYHADLQNAFALNDAECRNNDPDVDFDRNGLKGDCLGWNFSVHYTDPRARILKDENGHGTHVAGIIAARKGNEIGVSGLSNRIKILPLKVLREQRLRIMSDVLTEAILYSIRRKVDVINFSMGWSRSLDSSSLRGAVQVAINNGITVVAAAGNNSSNDSIYPCAYDRVICVGAIKHNGDFANFSNFGGNVDVLAPGESILSTTPQNFIPSRFPIFGYDLKNGTSQASPMVAASAAVLKGIYPEITENQVYSRLTLGASAVPEDLIRNKFTNFGLINLTKAIQIEETPHVIPNFKVVKEILYNPNTNKFALKMPIKNFWKEAKNITIDISHNQPHIELVNTHIEIDELLEGQAKQITILGDITDNQKESLIKLNFAITVDGNTKTFAHEIPILRQITGPGTFEKPIQFVGRPKPMAVIREGHIQPIIKTIDDLYNLQKFPHYYLTKTVEKEFTLILFKQDEVKIYENQKQFKVQNLESLISIQSYDLNYDGKADYLIQTIENEGVDKVLAFYYLDQDLNPLFKNLERISYRPKFAINSAETLKFRKHNHPTYGNIALPIFVEEGRIPLWDQDAKTYWDIPDLSVASHIYFYDIEKDDNGTFFKEHVLDTKKFQEKFSKDNQVPYMHEIQFISLVQNKDDFNSGIIKIIAQATRGYNEINYALEIQDNKIIKTIMMENNFEHLKGRIHNPVIDLSNNTVAYNASDIFSSFYTQTKLELLFLDSKHTEINDAFIYENEEETDHILGYLSTFKKDDSYTSFYQTRSNILVVKREKGKTHTFKRRLLRFSFLPGNILNELYFPIATQTNGSINPALYIDGTSISVNRIHLLQANENDVVSPIKFNMILPSACRAMNPVKYSDSAVSSYSFLCLNSNQEWIMLYHPLNSEL